MDYFDGIDRIFVINLQERTDRRAHMDRQFARFGLGGDARIHYFPAIRPESKGLFDSVGAHGVFLSHLAILRDRASDCGRILILEDDCLFSWRMARDAFAGPEDFIYGGVFHTAPVAGKESEEYGAHCIAYSPRVRPPLVAFLEERFNRGKVNQPYIAPVDGQIVDFRKQHPEYATRILEIAHQMPSDSDITPTDRGIKRLGLMQQALRRLKTLYLQLK